jgi:hypothetical protein
MWTGFNWHLWTRQWIVEFYKQRNIWWSFERLSASQGVFCGAITVLPMCDLCFYSLTACRFRLLCRGYWPGVLLYPLTHSSHVMYLGYWLPCGHRPWFQLRHEMYVLHSPIWTLLLAQRNHNKEFDLRFSRRWLWRVQSSRLSHRIVRREPDVSEEHISSIIRDEE